MLVGGVPRSKQLARRASVMWAGALLRVVAENRVPSAVLCNLPKVQKPQLVALTFETLLAAARWHLKHMHACHVRDVPGASVFHALHDWSAIFTMQHMIVALTHLSVGTIQPK